MSSMGLIATDIYLPVLPKIADYFSTGVSALQATIGMFFVGLSVSQLIYGWLSESYGRRPIIIVGMTIFTLSSFIISFTSNVHVFLIARFFQAVGACSGLTIGRVIIGEAYPKNEAGRIFTTVFPFIGLSPAIAPLIGGFINEILGWRAIFSFLGILGIILLTLLIIKLPETKTKLISQRTNLPDVFKNYINLLKSKVFIGYALCPCIAYIVNFAYLSEVPFILNKYHYSVKVISVFFIGNSISYLIGNFTARFINSKLNISRSIFLGYIFLVMGGLLMVLLNYHVSSETILFGLLFPCALLTFGMGFLLPLGSAGVISNFTTVAGFASGLLGFLQLGSAGLSSAFIGKLTDNNSLYMSWYILIFAIIGLISYLILIIFPSYSKK